MMQFCGLVGVERNYLILGSDSTFFWLQSSSGPIFRFCSILAFSSPLMKNTLATPGNAVKLTWQFLINCSGPKAQPSFHPVTEKVLPAEPTVFRPAFNNNFIS